MNILSRLEQLVDLTDTEQALADFICKYPFEFSNMDIQEVCQYCFVSKSTVYRLCKKVGLEGFTRLKLAVSRDYKEYLNTSVDYDFPIKANQPDFEIADNLEKLYDATVKSTKNLLDVTTYKQVAEMMAQAEKVTIYTSAGNIYFAKNFQFQMAEIGKDIFVPEEEYVQHLTASKSSSQQLALVISFEGRSRHIVSILKLLKETQTPLVFITSPHNKAAEQVADTLLYLSPYENHYNKISSFSSRLSLLYVLDVLYAHYFQLNYEANIGFKTSTYKRMVTLTTRKQEKTTKK